MVKSQEAKSKVLIFGRQPAIWVGLIESALALGIAVGLPLTPEQVAAVVAVVSAALGVYTAYVTTETLLAVVVGFAKAVLACAVGFGLNLSPELTGAIISFVTLVMSMFNFANTSPLAVPTFATGIKPQPVRRA